MDIHYGFGGFPQSPKRWYVCNLSWIEKEWKCKETAEFNIDRFNDQYADVPACLPRFVDTFVLQRRLNTQVPVTILSRSQGT